MKAIDVWFQHSTARFLEQPFLDSLWRWTKQRATEKPPEHSLSILQSAHVEKALIPAWYSPQGPLISNEEVLKVVEQYPDVFIGVASVDITHPVEAIRTLRKYVQKHGFKALRIVQWLWELPCTHPLYYPLFAECVELDIPVCLQVGLTGPLRSSESGKPHHIERVALDFPELKIVCGHIGYPWHVEMITYATKFQNVYIDTSAYKSNRYPGELVEFMKTHGKTKVMFGSNYPMIKPGDCLKDMEMLELEEEVKRLFLYENAERVFKIN